MVAWMMGRHPTTPAHSERQGASNHEEITRDGNPNAECSNQREQGEDECRYGQKDDPGHANEHQSNPEQHRLNARDSNVPTTDAHMR